MNTQELAERIVAAIKPLHVAHYGRVKQLTQKVREILDQVQAEHESCEPATIAKGPKS